MPPAFRSVLVVDDDRSLCDLLDVLLFEAGYHVRCVYDGEAARAAVQQAPPNLILSDIKMPKLDGIQLAVRLAETTYGIPVILMRAGHDDWAGVARAFLRKPFDVGAVLALAAVLLGVPYLRLAGGIALLWIAWKLVRPGGDHGGVTSADHLGAAGGARRRAPRHAGPSP